MSNHHQQQQQHHHHQSHQEAMRTLSSITTKLTMPNHRDKSTLVAVSTSANPEPSTRSKFTFDMSSSASSSYSSEETGDISSAPTTPVSDSTAPVFAIDMKAVDEKIGEALATPKASAAPKQPTVEDVVDVEASQEEDDVWQDEDEDEHDVWGDDDSDDTDSDDGSEWETESSTHEAEYETDDDCGIEFGDSDEEDEDEGADDGLFGYDSEEEVNDGLFGSDEEVDEGHLPELPTVDSHRQSDRPPLRPCLSHAHTSQPMKRSESTGSRVRFSDTAEKPQIIQTRVFMYSYHDFDNMVRSTECPNEIRSAFEDTRTEMEKFQELHALREFYISLLDPSEQAKERANPSNAIVGKMEHFLISKMMEKGGEDVLIEEPEKCTQFLMGIVGFGSLKLDEEEEKDNIKRRNGTVPPTATPAETPDGTDGEWETEDEEDEETETECVSPISLKV